MDKVLIVRHVQQDSNSGIASASVWLTHVALDCIVIQRAQTEVSQLQKGAMPDHWPLLRQVRVIDPKRAYPALQEKLTFDP